MQYVKLSKCHCVLSPSVHWTADVAAAVAVAASVVADLALLLAPPLPQFGSSSGSTFFSLSLFPFLTLTCVQLPLME